uniref:Uncharacterized protein n=1 Tax=Arundo donax TaxID=35708 RepID=A0A0A9B5X9_ARUDO
MLQPGCPRTGKFYQHCRLLLQPCQVKVVWYNMLNLKGQLIATIFSIKPA